MAEVTLNFNQLWTQAYAKLQSEIRIPPDLQQKVNEAGAVVIEKIEKDLHSLSLLNNINVHGAVGTLSGVMIPQLKNISTALDQAATVLTSDIMSQIPGVNFSIGNLMNIIPSDLLDEVFKAMPQDVGDAFNNIMKLTQNLELGNFGGSMPANRINLEVFIPQAVDLLKGVKNISELMTALNKLMTDKTIAGLDSLISTPINIGGLFGDFSMNIDGNGNLTFDISDSLLNSLQSFTKQLGGLTSTAGSLMDQVNNLSEMIGRHAPEVEAKQKSNLDTIGTTPSWQDFQTFIGGS